MTKDINETTVRIAKLNDAFRASVMMPASEQPLGQVVCTSGVMALPTSEIKEIAGKVSLFDDFNKSNDPYGEHDFGSFIHKDDKIYWKIDYKDHHLEYQSKGTPDPIKPNRILTIMLSHEW